MMAIFLPPRFTCFLVMHEVAGEWVLDGAATIAALASQGRRHLVTFGAYTAELELEVVSNAVNRGARSSEDIVMK